MNDAPIPFPNATAWSEKVANLRAALGREPTLDELLEAASAHVMTPEEYEAQRQS